MLLTRARQSAARPCERTITLTARLSTFNGTSLGIASVTRADGSTDPPLFLRAGIPAVDLHGNLSQPQRDRNLAAFANGSVRVLVATDIAARGIDVEALEHVVNFDVPAQPEDYIHRVGRTARADAEMAEIGAADGERGVCAARGR